MVLTRPLQLLHAALSCLQGHILHPAQVMEAPQWLADQAGSHHTTVIPPLVHTKLQALSRSAAASGPRIRTSGRWLSSCTLRSTVLSCPDFWPVRAWFPQTLDGRIGALLCLPPACGPGATGSSRPLSGKGTAAGFLLLRLNVVLDLEAGLVWQLHRALLQLPGMRGPHYLPCPLQCRRQWGWGVTSLAWSPGPWVLTWQWPERPAPHSYPSWHSSP